MNNIIYLIILVIIFIVLINVFNSENEMFKLNSGIETFKASPTGALLQLETGDVQDSDINAGYDNNIYEYGGRYAPYYPYGKNLWNKPTRTKSYYWPILYYYPTVYPWYYIYPQNQ